MQAIADAIVALGRSLSDIRANLWLCGAMASQGNHGPKCANGLVTMHLGFHKHEEYDGGRVWETNHGMLVELDTHRSREAARLAGVALVQAAHKDPTLLWEARQRAVGNDQIRAALDDPAAANLGFLGHAVVCINDVGYDDDEYGDGGSTESGMMGPEGAAKWFSDAIDILAKELPEPLPVEEPLTVEQIISARKPEPQLV